MTPKVATTDSVSQALAARWEQTAAKFAALAEAVPDAAYEAVPVEGIRTVAAVIRHVAFWNQYVADTLRGRKGDDAANELPEKEYSGKAKLLEATKSTAADVAAALADRSAPLDREAIQMIVSFIEHTSEHYGQLAVYARLNGIVPPASRT